ncbi:type II toxin-antitoxin system VapC family toxin [Archaeoglobus sp.]
MGYEETRSGKDRIEGVIDIGPVVLSHFENPAMDAALEFLSEVLKWNRKCIIPTSTILGAYHILTRYLRVEKVSAYEALTRTLKTHSPAFYENISVEYVLNSLTNALGYNIESWDGYIVSLAKKFRAAVYTTDLNLIRRVKDVPVVNPIPDEIFNEYNEWLKERLK